MGLNKNPKIIQKMFDSLAQNYDLINNLISFNTHIFFKKKAIKSLKIKDEYKILDLCSGSGDISKIIRKINPKCKIIGVDFSSKMIEIAKKKNNNIEFLNASATNLPFNKNEFDIVICAFGLRNIENDDLAIKEIKRVLKTKGEFLNLDFEGKSKFSFIYDFIILNLLKIFIKNIEPYKYLIESKKKFYNTKELIEKMEKFDFKCVFFKKSILNIISYQKFISF